MLNLQNISYAAGKKTIISDQNLTINKGEHLLLLGPSGCGKTTLMNVMAALLPPSEGDVKFDGKPYSALSNGARDNLRAANFGFIFQKLHLIKHLTVAQNIAIVQKKSNQSRVQELINELGLTGKEQQKARELSVGEAQRVAIARAVANNPKIIFADEPTSALDDENTEKVMNLMLTQATKTDATLIVATHDARIKGHFTNVLEMTA